MAEDVRVLIAKLKEFRDALPTVLPDVATSVALTGKAIAERQIRTKGFGATYSTNPVPAYWFKGKELNGKGLDYLYGLKADRKSAKPTAKKFRKSDNLQVTRGIQGETTWGEFRNAQGLQSDHVDLGYSNKMWAGMLPQPTEQTGFKYIAALGGTNTETVDKMNWNFNRYGDFVGKVLTGDNLQIMYDVAYDELNRLIEEKLGWTKK